MLLSQGRGAGMNVLPRHGQEGSVKLTMDLRGVLSCGQR